MSERREHGTGRKLACTAIQLNKQRSCFYGCCVCIVRLNGGDGWAGVLFCFYTPLPVQLPTRAGGKSVDVNANEITSNVIVSHMAKTATLQLMLGELQGVEGKSVDGQTEDKLQPGF